MTTNDSQGGAKKRFVAVGTGGRIPMFIDPIARDYKDSCELLALCDPSRVRMEYHRRRLAESYGYNRDIALYPAADFDRMLDETKPDTVIVCSMDSTHHEYIIRSLGKGCDVICEKPLTTDAEKCRAILEAVEKSGRQVRVTFNFRWSPGVTKVRELVQNGRIGQVKHVQMEYLLDTVHGADYFRRWHSDKASSGGLLVHKSTHHFDLVNWWIDGIPKRVYATGGLVFYGKKNAIARGEEKWTAYDRYTGLASPEDPFRMDLRKTESSKAIYLDAEKETGYVRDRNVFRDGIDIEDSMSALVTYRNGIVLNYSLNAFCPWEGFRVSLTGDRGRIEYEEIHTPHVIQGQSDQELGKQQAATAQIPRRLLYLPLFGKAESIPIPEVEGGHGGGDPLIQEQMFAFHPAPDAYSRNAQHEQGAASAIIGIAANKSIASGNVIDIDDLITLRPDVLKLSELK